MSTKRVIMYISILLFIFGISFAIYFSLCANIDDSIATLISDTAIGLAVGGLVALLIEIPMYAMESKKIKDILFVNGLYTCNQINMLTHGIESICNNPEHPISTEFCTYNLQRITKLSMPLQEIDTTVFVCKKRQRQVDEMVIAIRLFHIKSDSYDIDLKFKIAKQLHLNEENKAQGKQQVPINAELVKSELNEIKNNLQTISDTINATAIAVFNKTRRENWKRRLAERNAQIKSSSMYAKNKL